MRGGLRAVGLSLGILVATAIAQAIVFLSSGSVALLADLIHNVGDALTALPVGVAFLLRSAKAERYAGWAVVLAIAVSMIVAGATAVDKLINPVTPDHLLVLALAGIIGVVGNGIAAGVRTRAGRKLRSPALVADGHHAKVDALVSGGVVLTSALVGVGVPLADPIVALLITAMIGHVLVDAWRTVSGRERGHTH
jgi:cation diffusion facilitator family transporter